MASISEDSGDVPPAVLIANIPLEDFTDPSMMASLEENFRIKNSSNLKLLWIREASISDDIQF